MKCISGTIFRFDRLFKKFIEEGLISMSKKSTTLTRQEFENDVNMLIATVKGRIQKGDNWLKEQHKAIRKNAEDKITKVAKEYKIKLDPKLTDAMNTYLEDTLNDQAGARKPDPKQFEEIIDELKYDDDCKKSLLQLLTQIESGKKGLNDRRNTELTGLVDQIDGYLGKEDSELRECVYDSCADQTFECEIDKSYHTFHKAKYTNQFIKQAKEGILKAFDKMYEPKA